MLDSTNPERYVTLNQRFDTTLNALQTPRLVQLIADLRDATSAYLHIYATSGFPRRLDAEHREILAAFKGRDPRRAVHAVEQHLAHSLEHVTSQLQLDQPPATAAS